MELEPVRAHERCGFVYDLPIDESFSHDLDGNLTQDGTFDYVWDGENRLIRAATRMDRGTPGVYDNGDRKIECVYDYMSRRVRKTAYTWSGGWVEDADGDQLFVYDRWNVVLVLNANAGSDTLRKYTWGLDLSGWMGTPGVAGIHGAGGIGGLLAAEETATTGAPKYWFFCDGNGNVTQILDPNDFWPEPTAHYEYDPYGNLIRALDVDGSGYVNANLFRFSSKWLDTETGLYYYGYRYHDPRLGRWGSRDSISEKGGLNLFALLANNPVNHFDPIGKASFTMNINVDFNSEKRGAIFTRIEVRLRPPESSCCRLVRWGQLLHEVAAGKLHGHDEWIGRDFWGILVP